MLNLKLKKFISYILRTVILTCLQEEKCGEKACDAKEVKLYMQLPPIEKMDASLSTLSHCEYDINTSIHNTIISQFSGIPKIFKWEGACSVQFQSEEQKKPLSHCHWYVCHLKL